MKKRKTRQNNGKSHESVFYVGVPSPIDIRRSLLESSREVVQFLQRYEKLKAIRQEKYHATQQLRTDVRELRSLMNNLKKLLPKTNLRIKPSETTTPLQTFTCEQCGTVLKNHGALTRHSNHHKEQEEQKAKEETANAAREARKAAREAQKVVEQKQPEKPRHVSELDKLESELTEIEGKLGEL